MTWTFRVLGSGTALPDPERGSAGFLVSHKNRNFLIDGGSGTLGRLARWGVDPLALTAGIFSHRHVDHTGDLVPFLFALKVERSRSVPYTILAGGGFAAFLDGLHAVYGPWIQPPCGVTVQELALDRMDRVDLGEGLTLTTMPANHSAGALHLRFDAAGASVVFSGDTGPSAALAELAAGVDLLVTECAGSDSDPLSGHLNPAAVADLIQVSRPREVWLTHLYPQVDPEVALQVVGSAGVPVRRAADGDVHEFR